MIKKNVLTPHVFFTRETYFGKGTLSVIKNIDANKFLILVSKTIKDSEEYQKVERHLEGKEYVEEIIPACTEQVILSIKDKYKDYNPDVVIGVGGGKVIDAAKVVKYFLENLDKNFADLQGAYYNDNIKIKMVAVPTTPATGSETTYVAVVKNDEKLKIPYVNKSFLPDMAILDHAFLLNIAENLLIQLTADIFAHGYEGYFSKLSNPITKNLAIDCINLLKEGVKGYKANKTDKKSLEKISIAGYLGGIVAGNSFVGACHALAHSAESKINLIHSQFILNLLKPCITWHEEKSKSEDYDIFLTNYDVIGYDSYVESGIFESLDSEWWANAALQDPSVKTNSVRMKLDSMLELVNWIKTK